MQSNGVNKGIRKSIKIPLPVEDEQIVDIC
jgi:hypothetical protein